MGRFEAMAVGGVWVAQTLGGIADVLRDGKDGFVVPAENPSALIKALETVIVDAPLRHDMGLSARQRIEDKYSAKELSACYEALYHKVLTVRVGKMESL